MTGYSYLSAWNRVFDPGRGLIGVLVALLWLFGCEVARGMQFQRLPAGGADIFVTARGVIMPGDAGKLREFLGALPPKDHVLALTPDSPGGDINETGKLLEVLKLNHMPVAVLGTATCAGACFLLYAGAPKRFIAPNARVGVHSPVRGDDTPSSIASVAQELGLAPGMISRITGVAPGQVAWLGREELKGIGTIFIPPAGTVVNPAPPASAEEPAPAGSGGFEQGVADRRAWEAWSGSITGPYRDGAMWWAAERSKARPAGCNGPDGLAPPDWAAGCQAAQQMLAPFDRRRRSDAEYRAGWNSL